MEGSSAVRVDHLLLVNWLGLHPHPNLDKPETVFTTATTALPKPEMELTTARQEIIQRGHPCVPKLPTWRSFHSLSKLLLNS